MPQDSLIRVYEITVTVAPGVLPSTPASIPWPTEDNYVTDIEITVPSGHNGLTGIRLMKGDSQLFPWSPGTWVTENDYHRVFPVDGYMATRDLVIQMYNSGVYQHSFYLRMAVRNYLPTVSAPVQSGALDLGVTSTTVSADPLSPDAILGTDTVAALQSGTLTADQLAPPDVSAVVSQQP
jgi:hypothetical protein